MYSQLCIFEGNVSHWLKLLWKQKQPSARRQWTILVSLPMHCCIWFETHNKKISWPGHWLVAAFCTFKDTSVITCLLFLVSQVTKHLSLPVATFILPMTLSLLFRSRCRAVFLHRNSGFIGWRIVDSYDADLAMKAKNSEHCSWQSTKLTRRDAKNRIFYCLRSASSFQSCRKNNVWGFFFKFYCI